jgi:hypothetical protein
VPALAHAPPNKPSSLALAPSDPGTEVNWNNKALGEGVVSVDGEVLIIDFNHSSTHRFEVNLNTHHGEIG